MSEVYDFTMCYNPVLAERAVKKGIKIRTKTKKGGIKEDYIKRLVHQKRIIKFTTDPLSLVYEKKNEEYSWVFNSIEKILPYRKSSLLGQIFGVLIKELPEHTQELRGHINLQRLDEWRHRDGFLRVNYDKGIWPHSTIITWCDEDEKPIQSTKTYSLSIGTLCDKLQKKLGWKKWGLLTKTTKGTKDLNEKQRVQAKVLDLIYTSQRTDISVMNCTGLPASQCGMVIETHYVDNLDTVYVRLVLGARHPHSETLRDAKKRLNTSTIQVDKKKPVKNKSSIFLDEIGHAKKKDNKLLDAIGPLEKYLGDQIKISEEKLKIDDSWKKNIEKKVK